MSEVKDDRRESEIQSSIVKLLRGFGFTVLVTSRNLQRGGSAIQKGIPDLLVSIPGIDYGWVGVEVKTAKGRVKPEQQELSDKKQVKIARNDFQAALAVLVACEKAGVVDSPQFYSLDRWAASFSEDERISWEEVSNA
mgnify:CR=1 FL=1